MPLPRLTPWKLAGSAGGSVAVGTPVARLAITGNYLYFPLQNQTTKQTIVFEAVGVGVNVGVTAVPSPVHAGGRLPNFPSSQLGSLVAGIQAPNPMAVNDLMSYTNIAIGGADAAAGAQGGFSVAAFAPDKFSASGSWTDWATDVASSLIGAVNQPAGQLIDARAICVWGHVKGTTNVLSAGLRYTVYRVVKCRVI